MLGLALCGGGAKCAAHLGALKVFQEHGIEFGVLAGTSAGALVAVLYALGAHCREMERLVHGIRWHRIMGWPLSRYGLNNGARFRQFLREITGGARLEQLQPRVAVMATDVTAGTACTLQEGDAAEAIYASCALPGFFVPLRRDGRLLVDGSILSPLPVAPLRANGARVCVGIDFRPARPPALNNLMAVAQRSVDLLLQKEAERSAAALDVLVTPAVGHYSLFDFRHMAEMMREGERAARAVLPALMQKLRPGSP